ncbi:MAG: hypothetical protein GEV03_08485 [Streptosporangiales bacterium]|nr:hypothetical protein [Streptosporangiales bacterium]
MQRVSGYADGETDDRSVVFLHVGAPKTGTTFLQTVLWKNREALREDGVLYPGHLFAAHLHAAFDLRRAGFHGYADPYVPGAWDRIVDEARDWRGTVIISQEAFSPATRDQIAQAMAALSFAEVHLIYTARDLVRQIPAVWQEEIKNRFTLGFSDLIETLRAPTEERHPLGTMFWRTQDAVEVLDRWAHDLPPERVHVVTVPAQGSSSGLLWQRFAGVVGLDTDRYDTTSAASNPSLGAAEADLLRRVNIALEESIPWPVYNTYVKHFLGQEVLAGRPDPVKITLSAETHDWVVGRSAELVDGLKGAGYDIVGDLAELIPGPSTATPGGPTFEDIPAELQLSAAVDGMVGLIQRIARLPDPHGPLPEWVRHLEEELARRKRQPARSLIRDISERNRAVMRARAAWWHSVERARRLRAWLGRRAGSDTATHRVGQ